MKLTILHLYPDAMNLYGEYANIAVLRRHLELSGVAVTVAEAGMEAEPDFSGADLIYMGAGTERTQKAVLERLRTCKDAFLAAVERGALVLFTGSAMETLGASITDVHGKVWPGLGLADFTTLETDKRTPVDVIATPALWDAPAVGFMNKCSVTKGITTPLFTALPLGFGNEAEHGAEGYTAGNVLATHLTGPMLVKNPAFTDLVITWLFGQKGWPLPAVLPVLPHEAEAYAVTLRELRERC